MSTEQASQPDVTARDAIQIAQRALRKANEVDDLRERVADLEDELAAVKHGIAEHKEKRPYESLSLDEKVARVREHGYRRAADGHGKATLDYNDVMWEVFDGEPGAKHCYKLIRHAAGLEEQKTGSDCPGFTARDPSDGSYHLAVNAERAKATVSLFPENKATQEPPRNS